MKAPKIKRVLFDEGESTGGFLTNDNTLVLKGAARPGAKVFIFDHGEKIGAVKANKKGKWTFNTDALADGAHVFKAKAKKGLASSDFSKAVSGDIDTASPALPLTPTEPSISATPSTPDLEAASDTGTSFTDNVTRENTLTLVGIAEAGATVTIRDGGSVLGTAITSGVGTWSFTTGALSNGGHSFTATATEGNVSNTSSALAVTIDGMAPATPSTPDLAAASDTGTLTTDNLTSDNTPTLVGFAEAGATVTIRDGGTVLGTTSANGAGVWSFNTGGISNGGHNFTATATDLAGNVSDTSSALAVTIATSGLSSFAAFGDYGIDAQGPQTVADLVGRLGAEIVVTTGDNAYGATPLDDNIGQYYSDYIGNYTGSYGQGSEINHFFPSLGNHEYDDNSAGPNGSISTYLGYFTLPDNERYYDFQMGQVHLFVVDSESADPANAGPDDNAAQRAWLEAAMTGSDAAYKIVIMHHPPFSSGSHGPNAWMQWDYEEWGASAILAGHDHNYERIMRDEDGENGAIPYFVSGLGGNGSRAINGPQDPNSEAQFTGQLGTMLITVDDSGMLFAFYSVNDVLRDSYFLAAPAGGNPLSVGGDDTMNGSENSDYMNGLAGDDTITGFAGTDTLIGGAGNDRFVFHGSDGADVILDFMPGPAVGDVLDYSSQNIGPGNLSIVNNPANNAVITNTLTGDIVELRGVNSAALSQNDFLF